MNHRIYIFLFSLSLFFTGCLRDEYVPCPSDILLELRLPRASSPATYAMTNIDETTVTKIDVLVFTEGGTDETFLYATEAVAVTNDPGNLTKTFKVTLLPSDGLKRQRIVLLANLPQNIAAYGITEGMTKTESMELLVFATPTKWDASTGSPVYLPMWGESPKVSHVNNKTTGESFGSISLLRSVARIDVGLNINISGLGDLPQGFADNLFKISDVRVYNSSDRGLIAPNSAAGFTGQYVTNPTILAGTTTNSYLPYQNNVALNGFIREIYVSEYKNKGISDDNLFFLLVGGFYTAPGSAANTTKKTWYRVDFYDRSQPVPDNARFDILRNHRYIVNITSVDGEGFDDPAEAAKTRTLKMTADVIPWNLEWSNVELGISYKLNITEKWFTCSAAETEINTTVTTDYTGGWFIEKIVDDNGIAIVAPGDWLEASRSGDLLTIVTTQNNTGTSRKGKIYIKAGQLREVLYITQEK